ncbi:glycosyltransferase [Bacteroides sp. An19]|uniref:glycosyltransferase family 2 protein n=1 Tax=Bacteroides sp. An19 TaxID=1965580 RepID=UPI000B55E794|nr:glycosyltransferase [Bacteroides sp. An19]OUP32154.1 hypothetical protein B5F25_09495 [Bacteroides sp. An19]
MNTPLISIIIPIYNAEHFISRCIESVLSQKNTNFELLLIDDGSTDKSKFICDEYARKDSRIHVIHKQNGGVSSARNLGLDKAKGEWVSFVDADDYLSDDFLNIEPAHVDCEVIQKSYNIIENISTPQVHKIKKSQIISGQNRVISFFVNKRNNELWNKIIKRNVIKDRKFDENTKIGEDMLFFATLLKDISHYALSSIGYYNYVKNDGSAMKRINDNRAERYEILKQNIQKIRKACGDNTISDSIIYRSYILNLLNNSVTSKDKIFAEEVFKSIKKRSLSYLSSFTIVKVYLKFFFYRNLK